MAQSTILDRARSEADPLAAAQAYADYISEFEDNVSWVQLAARDRFELIAKHPDQFDAAALRTAAEDAEPHGASAKP